MAVARPPLVLPGFFQSTFDQPDVQHDPSFPNFRNHSNSDYQKIKLDFYFGISEISDAAGAAGQEVEIMEQTGWPPEHSSALRRYLAAGLSFSEDRQGDQSGVQDGLYAQRRHRPRQENGTGGFRSSATCVAANLDPTRAWSELSNLKLVEPGFGGSAPAYNNPEVAGAAEAALRRGRAAPPFADRARARRLPLSLWRRRRGGSHHLLRSSASARFELLRAAFSVEPQSRRYRPSAKRSTTRSGSGSSRRHNPQNFRSHPNVIFERRPPDMSRAKRKKAPRPRQGA